MSFVLLSHYHTITIKKESNGVSLEKNIIYTLYIIIYYPTNP